MRLMIPDSNDKSEIAGRYYEACDLQLAIEGGELKTIDDVRAWVQERSGLDALMELPVWVMTENCCIDTNASIQYNKKSEAPSD